MSEKSRKRNKGITLHPLKVNDALRVMLAAPPVPRPAKPAKK